MAQDDFLLVVPNEWIELENAAACITMHMQMTQLQELIANQEWIPVSQLLEDCNVIQPNTLISDARIVKAGAGEDSWKVWYKL